MFLGLASLTSSSVLLYLQTLFVSQICVHICVASIVLQLKLDKVSIGSIIIRGKVTTNEPSIFQSEAPKILADLLETPKDAMVFRFTQIDEGTLLSLCL
jgi:hypothetical protein